MSADEKIPITADDATGVAVLGDGCARSRMGALTSKRQPVVRFSQVFRHACRSFTSGHIPLHLVQQSGLLAPQQHLTRRSLSIRNYRLVGRGQTGESGAPKGVEKPKPEAIARLLAKVSKRILELAASNRFRVHGSKPTPQECK